MSVNATTTSTSPPTNGLKGVAPAIFDGKRSQADNFLNKFHRYKLLNRKNGPHHPILYLWPPCQGLGQHPGPSSQKMRQFKYPGIRHQNGRSPVDRI
jgi:hypothetical protein